MRFHWRSLVRDLFGFRIGMCGKFINKSVEFVLSFLRFMNFKWQFMVYIVKLNIKFLFSSW